MRAPANPSGGPAGPMAGRPAVLPQPTSTPLPAIPQPQPVAPASNAPSQSLLDLFNAARTYDASYLATSAVAESAIYRARQADALNLPAASVGAALTHTEVDVPVYGRLSSNNQQITLQGRQPLFNLTNRATIDQAYRNLDLARADLDVAEQDLIVRLAQAYFDVLAAQDAVATNLANKNAITEQLAAARRNFEVGTATITDTREAQARFDLATAQQIASDNDLINRRIALDTLVGMKGVNPRQIVAPLALPALSPAGVEQWATIALDNHPSIRRAQLGLDIARLEVDKSRAAQYPTVDLVGSAGPSRSTGGAVALSGLPGTTTSATVGVQVNMTLFSGFAQQNRIRETLLLQDRSVQDVEAARRGVDQATRQTYYSLQSGRAQVQALEAAESSSLLALEATQTGYRVGVRVNLDVLNAQTQLYTTQQNLASARYNLLLGSLRLRQAAGTLSAGDVQSINYLLAP
jgi:outer membrane protein